MTDGYPWYWRLKARMPAGARTSLRRGADAVTASIAGSVNGGGDPRQVCLTLDDGPDPEVTPGLLKVLAAASAPCTFFLLADRAAEHPELVRDVVAAGHEVALHGRDHRTVSTMSAAAARAYLGEARDMLEQVAGRSVRLFRPPYGAQSVSSYVAARRSGLDVVVWSTDAQDWVDRAGHEVVRDAVTGVPPGGVLLFHERLEPHPLRGAPETTFDRVDAVRDIVAGLRDRGLEPTTVGHVMRGPGVRRTTWFRP
jgi:peptidoglycan/xylan/chitin deacetylase (PgdA/CDA1 family)